MYPNALQVFFFARGIGDFKVADKFLNPSLKDLYDPYLFEQMEKAVERIIRARDNKEIIWIHGDYDADGTSSVAMLTDFLRKLNCNVYFYIPDRFTEGFGLSELSITKAKAAGASVVISVDVGITAFNQAELVNLLILI